ncbi:MAG: HIT domain-containing protein [Alphaproteobacteria bacterium]
MTASAGEEAFRLDPCLQQDCRQLGQFPLCRLLLMRDAGYPWFILVPARPGITEIYQLAAADQQQLLRESSLLAEVLARQFRADKINIAALGNVVAQLHVHHVVRYRGDPAWPAPVWGHAPTQTYTPVAEAEVIARLREGLPADCGFAAAD